MSGPHDPQEWLQRARSNLTRARHRIQGVHLEDLCFDAQRAAEKALKALLISLGVRTFPPDPRSGQLTHADRTVRTFDPRGRPGGCGFDGVCGANEVSRFLRAGDGGRVSLCGLGCGRSGGLG